VAALRVCPIRVGSAVTFTIWCILKQILSAVNYTMRSLIICITHPVFSGDQIEKNEMGGACNTYGV